ncbi:MAG: DUF4129 domain-containing protein [Chloroflexota bacterium]
MRPSAARLFFIFGIVFALTGLTSPAIAAPAASTGFQDAHTTIDEAAYWELVQRTRNAAFDLRDLPEPEIKAGLAALTVEWESVTRVRGADGGLIPVDNGYLIETLRAVPPQPSQVVEILDALLYAHDENPGRVFSIADLAPLQAILARPEFDWPEEPPDPINEWFQKVWERINQWLNSVFGDLQFTFSIDSSFLPILAGILLVVILFFVFNTVFADFVREARLAADRNGGDEILTAESAFEKAQTLSRGGDYRSSVRYLYLSSLLALDERGLLRYDRSKTNREYLRSVANSPELSEPLEDVIEVFDDVWYGYHSLEEKSFQQYSDRVRELKEKKG